MAGIIGDYMRREEMYIQFAGDVADEYNPAGGLLTLDISVDVTNATGNYNPMSGVTEVTVNITGGTAPGAKVNGQANTVVVAITDGRGTLTVTATGVGTVALAMVDSGGTGLDVDETVTVNFTAA